MAIKIPEKGFLPLTQDQVFKYVFLRRPGLLAKVINRVLALKNFSRIQKLKHLPQEFPREQLMDRGASVDLCALDDQRRTHLVEMQSYRQKGYGKRMSFYGSLIQSKQLQKGQDFWTLPPLFCIHFVRNFTPVPEMKKFWGYGTQFYEESPQLSFPPTIHYFTIQLDRFRPRHYTDVKTPFEALCFVIKYTPEMKEKKVMDHMIQQAPETGIILETLSDAQQEFFLQLAQDKAERDRTHYMNLARYEGMIKTARKMLQDQEPMEKIARFTELPLQEIQRLDRERKAKA